MQIPLSSPDITDIEINAVISVLKTPSLSLGPKLPEFEKIVADYIEVKHAVAVNSGTSALHLIVKSLGLSEGDEVITSPFSFIASSNCLLFEKVHPVFTDIDPITYNIDVNQIEKKITKKTKAILVVDVFGLPADWEKLQQIAEANNLLLIEDSCEALGAEHKSQKVGGFGDAGCFAFYPNKQITTGEGGVIVTNNDNIAKLSRSLRNQGRLEEEGWLQHPILGYNYRLSDINCALGIAQMQRIGEILAKREKVASLYNERLKRMEPLELPPLSSSNLKRSWFVYVVKLCSKYSKQDRKRILTGLREKGIGCNNYFPPIHLQPFYVEKYGYKNGDFPITESVAERTIALPFFNNLSEGQINYVVDNLRTLL
ncbi:MAG: DegT/DnrJ/EryC1/StrS family aminotransferase [Candidatus Margulisbacteria bacterium]|nr:DegT/DnrJ/EryC1/StrS family aminotransferase [Candidatus Margulisiibacteriota bacterium]